MIFLERKESLWLFFSYVNVIREQIIRNRSSWVIALEFSLGIEEKRCNLAEIDFIK